MRLKYNSQSWLHCRVSLRVATRVLCFSNVHIRVLRRTDLSVKLYESCATVRGMYYIILYIVMHAKNVVKMHRSKHAGRHTARLYTARQ